MRSFRRSVQSCGAIVENHGHLCADCWGKIGFIEATVLPMLRHTARIRSRAGRRVRFNCAGSPPACERARSVMLYGDVSRSLILKFKHADRLDPAPAFARWMARSARELLT